MTTSEPSSYFKALRHRQLQRYPVCWCAAKDRGCGTPRGIAISTSFPGWGCDLIGHCPPRVVEAVQEQVGQLIHVPNTWYTEAQGQLAEALSERTGFAGRASFAIAGPRRTKRPSSLPDSTASPDATRSSRCSTASTAGRMGALSATGQPKYHAGVEPLLAGFRYAPFGDLEAVAKLIDAETCAIMVEPIQGEGGINLPPPGYLEGLRELADQHKLLLIFDEVQTGMGRTGKWYAYQHWTIQPDVITLGESSGRRRGGGRAVRQAAVRREVGARHARGHLRRQPPRLPRGPGDHRNDRSRRPARARGANRDGFRRRFEALGNAAR